jgi:hypothetical protein
MLALHGLAEDRADGVGDRVDRGRRAGRDVESRR